jgi:putative two-component system response regulator
MLNNHLGELVEAKTETIKELKDAILKTMADLVEARDKYTGGHVERTQRYLDVLLKKMREKDEYRENDKYKEALESLEGKDELILQSAQLHDVGKIAIKDNILNKPGKLDKEEFEEMKTHTSAGEKVFDDIKSHTSDHEFLEYARVFAVTHHEKWDGTGYPNELKDDNIPLLGRLMAIADVYDAVVSERPYKEAQPHEVGVDAIKNGKGTQFDPALVDLFLEVEVANEFKKIYEDCKCKTSGTDKSMKTILWYCEKIKNHAAEVENIVKANMNGKETPFDPALINLVQSISAIFKKTVAEIEPLRAQVEKLTKETEKKEVEK